MSKKKESDREYRKYSLWCDVIILIQHSGYIKDGH